VERRKLYDLADPGLIDSLIGDTECDISSQSVVQNEDILCDISGIEPPIDDLSIDQKHTLRRNEKTEKNIDQRRLARAGRADDSHHFSTADDQIDVGQRRIAAAGISKCHAAQLDLSLKRNRPVLGRIDGRQRPERVQFLHNGYEACARVMHHRGCGDDPVCQRTQAKRSRCQQTETGKDVARLRNEVDENKDGGAHARDDRDLANQRREPAGKFKSCDIFAQLLLNFREAREKKSLPPTHPQFLDGTETLLKVELDTPPQFDVFVTQPKMDTLEDLML